MAMVVIKVMVMMIMVMMMVVAVMASPRQRPPCTTELEQRDAAFKLTVIYFAEAQICGGGVIITCGKQSN